MLSDAFVQSLVQARRRLRKETWQRLVENLANSDATTPLEAVIEPLLQISNKDVGWLLGKAFRSSTAIRRDQLPAVMSVIDSLVSTERISPEIIWSGPSNGLFPVRRIDQVLYDLINEASQRMLLVTFAAHRIERLCSCIHRALLRGVSLTLVLEAEQESEGQLSRDALSAFSSISAAGCRIFYWPIDQRTRNAAGKPGKLHAKCAVIDSSAIIGSANLTDDAFNRNLEMGILLRGGPTPDQIFSHFNALIDRGVLREISLG
jgi:phosphatidylserine/phosphatidylglycerophosphate/cardiolipin synthase-like enzyme